MKTDLIIISEYCQVCNIDPSFIFQLGEDGLIDIQIIEQESYLYTSQLNDIEMFTRLHYDLSINTAGIDAINHLLQRMKELRKEINYLRNQLSLNNFPTIDNIEEI